MEASRRDVTQLMNRLGRGDRTAESELAAVLQGELRQLAAHIAGPRAHHQTLQPTALVNEAWLRLLQKDELEFDARSQFYSLAATIMRGVVVDKARARNRLKREGAELRISMLDVDGLAEDAGPDRSLDALALEEALKQLEVIDPEAAQVVVLRFFGGLTHAEISATIGVSVSTVERSWRAARAYLTRQLER